MKSFLDKSTLQGMAILVGLGLVVGLVGNLAAGPTRHLEWGRDYPPKGKPNCPETLPEPGAASSATPMPAPTVTAAAQPEPAPIADPAVAAEVFTPVESEPAASPATATSVAAPPVAPPAATALAAVAAPSAPASIDVPAVPPGKPWLELTPEQVDAVTSRGALFIDARMTSQYQEGHVQGAIAIPIWESGVDEKIAQVVFEAEGDMARPIVVYCNGGDCEDSHNLGQKLWEAGHQAVYVYKDGYPDWVKRGRPISTGDAR